MSIRDTLNKQPVLAAAVVGGLIVIAVLAFARLGGNGRQGRVKQMFYSDDDGATYFRDDVDRIYPFDHNGKPAYRAYVYRCGAGGQPYVAYLARYPDDQKKKLEELTDKRDTAEWSDAYAHANLAIQVKKPGDAKWASRDSSITIVRCPDGDLARGVVP